MYLNIKEDEDIKESLDYKIVKLLFEREKAELMAINHNDSYMVYFREHYISDFSLGAMKDIIEGGLTQKRKVIDKFIAANDTSFFHEFLYKVMDSKDKLITTELLFYNYLDILIYVVSKTQDFNLSIQLLSMLNKEDVKHFNDIGLISSVGEYKEDLKSKLKGNYPDTPCYTIKTWILDLIRKGKDYAYELIFDKEELLDINKTILNDLIGKEPIYNNKHLQVLYNCITSIDDTDNRTIRLDKEACILVKKLIEDNPKEYLNNFIDIRQEVIACEPFCVQIFGSEDAVERFLLEDRHDYREDIDKIRNVWKWYRLNNCNYINVDIKKEDWDRMLENNFEEEAKLVDKVSVLLTELDVIKEKIKPVLDLVKGYSSNRFSAEAFIQECMREKLVTEDLVSNLEDLLSVINRAKEIDLIAFRKNEIVDFDWKSLKLYSGGDISELEIVIDILSGMFNDNYNEDRNGM